MGKRHRGGGLPAGYSRAAPGEDPVKARREALLRAIDDRPGSGKPVGPGSVVGPTTTPDGSQVRLAQIPKLDLREVARQGLGLNDGQLPGADLAVRNIVFAEVVRCGLYNLYLDGEQPVHPVRLRAWVRHKLEAVLPDVFSKDSRFSYGDLMDDGPEYLGDCVVGERGLLIPAPPRLVPLGDGGRYALISGQPTEGLRTVRALVSFAGYGRIVVLGDREPHELGLRTQTLDSYLGGQTLTADGIISQYRSSPRQRWTTGRDWECYQGNNHSKSGFSWGPKEPRGTNGVYLYREPLSEKTYGYWLRLSPTEGVPVSNRDWKRLAIALDRVWGLTRAAEARSSPEGLLIRLNFVPFEAMFRFLRVSGSVLAESHTWIVPAESGDSIVAFLKRSGVDVRRMG